MGAHALSVVVTGEGLLASRETDLPDLKDGEALDCVVNRLVLYYKNKAREHHEGERRLSATRHI